MKKFWKAAAVAVVAALVGGGASTYAEVQQPIDKNRLKLSLEVLVNARRVAFPDMRPVNQNGYVMVPLRFVSDKLGGKLNLVGKDITIVKDDRTVQLTIGAKTATANGKTITLGVAADAVKGRTMVPLRFISEALGEKVEWDAVNQYVWIGSKDVPNIEDVVPDQSFSKYADYFKGHVGDFVSIKVDNTPYTKIKIVASADFPFKIGDYIYYRIDRAFDIKGREYVRMVSNDLGSLGRPIQLFRRNKDTRIRDELYNIREDSLDTRVQYASIISIKDLTFENDKNYDKLRFSDIDFLNVYTGGDFAVLFKNDFAK